MKSFKEGSKYFIPIVASIGLLIVCIVLIVLNYNNYKQLRVYETTQSSNVNTPEEKDHTISELLSQIDSLQNQIQVQNPSLQERSVSDMTALLNEYYTLDELHTLNTRVTAITPYLTEDLTNKLSPNFADLQGGNTNHYLYQSKISIDKGRSYYYFLKENNVMVILPATITVSTKWGTNESEKMFFISSSYNSTTDKWVASNIQYIENAVLQPLN